MKVEIDRMKLVLNLSPRRVAVLIQVLQHAGVTPHDEDGFGDLYRACVSAQRMAKGKDGRR